MNIAVIKLNREFKNCLKLEKFNIEPKEDDIKIWKVSFEPKTKIYTKPYNFTITFPENFPFDSPKIKFSTKIFHPNINKEGVLCMGILSEWNKKYSVSTIFEHLASLFEEPDLTNPTNVQASKLWGKKEYLNYV